MRTLYSVSDCRARHVPAQAGLSIVAIIGLIIFGWSFRTPTVSAQAAPTATPTPDCPPGEFWDPFMTRCRPIRQDCPAGKIDVNGDGSVCEALDTLPAPSGCVAWPTGPGYASRMGASEPVSGIRKRRIGNCCALQTSLCRSANESF